ncbi:hypothetical protein HZC27_03385 [Candidatus Roizmanbacteria bacterium]|nr:hypothetical protein [Candidatus Roizmanbacteria bacterium]
MILTIPLPERGKPLIKVGQRVDFNTPLFEEKIHKEVKVFISQKIGVSPKKIFQHLKKLVGDTIQTGDLLAENKSFMAGRRYTSEHTGILKEINHIDGSILIEVSSTDRAVRNAFFIGEAVKIEDGSLQIKVASAHEYEIKNGKDSFGGKAVYVKNENDSYDEESVSGNVVIANTISGYHQTKMEALGASGFATLHILNEITSTPAVLFKQIKDFEDAVKHHLPYCFIDGKTSKIVFYT